MITTINPAGKFSRSYQSDVVFVAAAVFFTAYLFLLVQIFFFQFDFHWGTFHVVIRRDTTTQQLLAKANLIPFYKILYYVRGCEPYSVGALNVAGNMVLFIPMGIGLSFFFTVLQNFKRLCIVVALISLSVEVLQLITATGVFDIDDVLLNTIGALAGCWIFNTFKNLKLKAKTDVPLVGSFDF